MRSILSHSIVLLVATCMLLAGCGDDHDHKDHDHKDHGHKDHEHKDDSEHSGHSHDPKFGGVLIEVGDHEAHLELNVDDVQEKVFLYVWDGEVENAVRIEQPSVEIAIKDGKAITLTAVENENTGEKPGDASTFACPKVELLGKTQFEATIKSISIQGKTFKDVVIEYPAE